MEFKSMLSRVLVSVLANYGLQISVDRKLATIDLARHQRCSRAFFSEFPPWLPMGIHHCTKLHQSITQSCSHVAPLPMWYIILFSQCAGTCASSLFSFNSMLSRILVSALANYGLQISVDRKLATIDLARYQRCSRASFLSPHHGCQ